MTTRITGMYSGLDTDTLIKQMTATQRTKRDNVYKQQQTVKYKQDAWKSLNSDVNAFFNKLSKLRLSSTYKKDGITSSNSNVASVTGNNITGTNSIEVKQVATATFVTGATINNSTIGQNGTLTVKTKDGETNIDVTSDMTMKDLAKKLQDAGLNANFDTNTNRMFLSSKDTGENSNFEITGDSTLLNSVGLGIASVKKEGQNAIINLNGADFEQDSNTFKINDMTITANEVGKTTIKNQSTDKTLETIKDFINSYNELIKKIATSYNNDTAKGYKPLTDDEKSALSDKQVDDWENKLKDGALYKDSNAYELSNILKNSINSLSVGGISLSSIGISTGQYLTTDKNERGVLNINEDKLREAISKDADKVIDLISKAASSIYDKLNDKMKSSTLNSVYSVYNDKQLKKQYEDYEKSLSKWDSKIAALEDKYYSQYAKMETLLSKMQSQSDYMSSFFG